MSPMQLREGVRLIGDHGTLRAALEVRPDCIHVELFDMEPQSPVQLASGDSALQDDFDKAKEVAVSLIADVLGSRSPEELNGIRAALVWRSFEEDAKPQAIQACDERLLLEKQMLVALHNQLLCEEATKGATAEGIAKAKQEEGRARAACEVAAEELHQHQSEHGC